MESGRGTVQGFGHRGGGASGGGTGGLLGLAISAEYFAAAGQYADIAAATRRLMEAIRAEFDPLPNVLVNVNVPVDFGGDSPVQLTRPSVFTLFRDGTIDDCEVDEGGG